MAIDYYVYNNRDVVYWNEGGRLYCMGNTKSEARHRSTTINEEDTELKRTHEQEASAASRFLW